MRISDWSSDVCSSDLLPYNSDPIARDKINAGKMDYLDMHLSQVAPMAWQGFLGELDTAVIEVSGIREDGSLIPSSSVGNNKRSEEHTSELQSLMRISYAVFCLKNKKKNQTNI